MNGKGHRQFTQESLKELFIYEPETGVFIRLKQRRTAYKVNPGSLDHKGYIRISVLGKNYLAHRLAWFYVYGEWPKQQIDHINRIKTDNRIANLRDVSNAENKQNIVLPMRTNKLRVTGVYRAKRRFKAEIEVGGVRHYLGMFTTVELASQAYQAAKLIYHPKASI